LKEQGWGVGDKKKELTNKILGENLPIEFNSLFFVW